MAVQYDNPFKIYFGSTTGSGGPFWAEATADTYQLSRMMLLGHSFFFTGGTMTDAVQESYIRTTFAREDIDWLDSDSAPVIVNIESADGITSWEPFQPHVTTDVDAYEAIRKMNVVLDILREKWPQRRMGIYGWTPDTDWYAVKNWLSVQTDTGDANYSSYLSWYLRWQRENERVKRGGVVNSTNNRGSLAKCDFLMPWMYLPNDTAMTSGTVWYDNADGRLWSTFFTHCMAEAKRLFQKPCLPMIQFFKPETTTYISDAWTTHQLDVAYNDPNCDGVVIYHPTGGATSSWRTVVSDWITENLAA